MLKPLKPNKTNKTKLVIVDEEPKSDAEIVKKSLIDNNCDKIGNLYSSDSECNKFLLRKEFLERQELAKEPEADPYLYPNLNDPLFNVKIAEKSEFADNKFDGKIYEDVKARAEELANADFELSPNQTFVRNFLSFQTPYNSLLLYGELGSGKCHAINTPIIMYDGSIKMVQDIQIGDLLMGDDSTPRTVTSLARGKDKMYNIIPVKGDKYTVNEEHILCLKASGFPKLCHNHYNSHFNFNVQWLENNKFKTRNFSYNKNDEDSRKKTEECATLFFEEIKKNENTCDNVFEISVKDYLKLSKKYKAFLKGYKAPVDFEEKSLPIDPYMIGYWLGYGSKRDAVITSQDSSVLKYFNINLKEYGLTLNFRSNYDYGISGNGKLGNNKFLNTLKELNMVNNKHIPMIYKCNSRENRLKLLAGLIDSDGHLGNDACGFEFTQKNEVLMDDVIFLARSLGFSCYKSIKKTTWTYKGVKKYGFAYRTNINGEGVEEIPTIIPRKRANSRKQIKNVLVTGINVEYVNYDDYYGFTLDGNCRYLMGDFTVTHNTCSAIGVAEEMRDYLKQMGINKRTIIVASPNVQDNFRRGFFDDRKLKLVDGLWNIRDCTGNKFLKEINPMNMKGIPKDKIITQINAIINASYIFLGYVEFANYINKVESGKPKGIKQVKRVKGDKHFYGEYKTQDDLVRQQHRNLRNEFNGRLVIIDEIHNIRISGDTSIKLVADSLMSLVKATQDLRILLLSATPMYNDYKEIVWLLNLMNANDKRGLVEIKDIFEKDGEFKKNSLGEEVGKELLIQKATGYVSFVKGNNPYTFPFKIFPQIFSPEHTFRDHKYPIYQMNGKMISEEDKLKFLDIYLTKIGPYQELGYKFIIDNLKHKKISITTNKGVVKDMPSFENMDSFGYVLMTMPLESLIMVYPIEGLENAIEQIKDETISDASVSTSYSDNNQKSESIGSIKSLSKLEGEEISKPKEDSLFDEYIPKSAGENEVEQVSEAQVSPSSGEEEESEVEEKPQDVKLIRRSSSESSVSSAGGGSSPSEELDNYFISPNDIVGKKGLERIMSFVDSNRPPLKGSFEYKPKTLQKYGRIFSKDEIGKYSSKIKSICDAIVNSEGISLIYSQYIDAALVPMALALEEIGFSRFGQGAKSLFKTPPLQKSTGLKYCMITGDPRLSPNNDFEVKSITNEDNKNGERIKVVLISQAGTEGIDFKFLRQVHILEPWYNMSRLEQIIGRAVRNFSHKSLPFEKRNVQIFMYGTLLENEEEEAADLYVYRVAEYKAVQIGKVSRVLKETAIDCIINHSQTMLTQELMNIGVEQKLSNGQLIQDFKIGDAPYSASCDYMECDYNCSPDKKIESPNDYTYTEAFILMNAEKILKKIRTLMKERYFYLKKDLIQHINIPRPYPLVQIYAALTQLVEDTSEFITDKYGRTGYLINIGEYYLFQPSELNNNNISIFDRSVPIDFKPDSIKFDIKRGAMREVIDVRNIDDVALMNENVIVPAFKKGSKSQAQKLVVESEARELEAESEARELEAEKEIVIQLVNDEQNGLKILQELNAKFNTAIQASSTTTKIPRGEEDWYKYCGITMRKLIKDFNIPNRLVLEILIEHIVDMLDGGELIELLNYLFLKDFEPNSFEDMVKKYLEKKIIKTSKQLNGFVVFIKDKRKIFVFDNSKNKWVPAEFEDENEINKEINERFIFNKSDFSPLVGFIGYDQKNSYLVFKIKDTQSARNTGARCDEAGKAKKLQVINSVLGEEKYNKDNTKGMGQAELCSLIEFIMRYYNNERKDGKIWFLTLVMAHINKFL
uniref:DOD-type homing endonuclease domain-containing protein n=1 Tax=viral metagenome TaxID=1070528 RepID=A0A6C0KTR6_9ZZZZ